MEEIDEAGRASRATWHNSGSLWLNKTFIGLFCDPYTSDTNLEGGPPVPAAREIGALSRTLSQLACLGLSDAECKALDRAGIILEEGAKLTEGLHGEDSPTRLKDSFLQLASGEMLLILGGWSKKSSPGHAVIYLIERVSDDEYAFTIVNTGDGVGYHPSYAGPDCYPKTKSLCAWRLTGIKKRRICHEAFCMALLMPSNNADDKNGAGQLYEVLLPYLVPQHSGGLTQATCPEWGCSQYCTSTQKAGYCYFKCVAHALRYLWARFGVEPSRRKRFMLHLRRMAVAALEDNLKRLLGSKRKRPLARAGQIVVDLACRQLMLKSKRERRAGLPTDELASIQRLVASIDEHAAKLTWDQRIPHRPPIWAPERPAEVDFTLWTGLSLAMQKRSRDPKLGTPKPVPRLAELNLLHIDADPPTIIEMLRSRVEDITAVKEDRWSRLQAAAVVEWGVSRLLPRIQPDGSPWNGLSMDKKACTKALGEISRLAHAYAECVVSSTRSPAHHAVQIITIGALLAAYDATLRAGADLTQLGALVGPFKVYSRNTQTIASLPIVSPEWSLLHKSLIQYHPFGRGADIGSMPKMDEKKRWLFNKEARGGSVKETLELVRGLVRATGLESDTPAVLVAALDKLREEDQTAKDLTIEDLGEHAKHTAWMFDGADGLRRKAPQWHDYLNLMILWQWIARSPMCRRQGDKAARRMSSIEWSLAIKMIGPKFSKKPEVLISGSFQAGAVSFDIDLANLFPKSCADVSMHEPKACMHDEASVVLLPQYSLSPFAPRGDLCLTEEEAEVVLSALTTPLLRIPLLLRFFADDRLPLLRHARLRMAFESALSEPGRGGSMNHELDKVPAAPHDLGTPEGVLMFEVRHNPNALWSPLASILQDAGELSRLIKYDSAGVEVFMVVVRVMARMQRALRLCEAMQALWQTFLVRFGRDAVGRLQQWFQEELANKGKPPDVLRCSKFHAHIALCIEPSLAAFEDASAAMVSLTYVSAWIPQKAPENEDEKKDDGEGDIRTEDEPPVLEELAGVGLCEIWECMQAWRPVVVKLLREATDEQRKVALNAAVRAVSHGAPEEVDFVAGSSPGYYTGTSGVTRQTITVDLQRFQVVFHDQDLRPMPASIAKTLEYSELFGDRYPNCRLQLYSGGALVEMVIDAEAYELRYYNPHRPGKGDVTSFPSPHRGKLHFDGLEFGKTSASNVLSAVLPLEAVSPAVDALKELLVDKVSDELFAKEIGVFRSDQIGREFWVPEPEALRGSFTEVPILCSCTVKEPNDAWYEIRLPRHTDRDVKGSPNRRLVRVFSLVDHGRLAVRCEQWASDYRMSLHPDLVPSVLPRDKPVPFNLRACAGDLGKPTHSFTESLQTRRVRDGAFHVPRDCLFGLLPGVLLEKESAFTFWQLESGGEIIGEPSAKSDWFDYRLHITGTAQVRVHRQRKGGPRQFLLNAVCAPDGSTLLRLARLFAPLERLSHVLFWCGEPNGPDDPELLSIELPRLQLRFAPRTLDEFGTTVGPSAHSGPRPRTGPVPEAVKWQIKLGDRWSNYDGGVIAILEAAFGRGEKTCRFQSHGRDYVGDFESMEQVANTGKRRQIRRTAEAPGRPSSAPPVASSAPASAPVRSGDEPVRITRLESVEYDGFYVLEMGELAEQDARAEQLRGLLEAVPHSLVLRSRSGQIKVLVANVLSVRPRVKELPFTITLAHDFGMLPQLSRRCFAWDLHAGGSLLLPTTLVGTLYLCLLRFLHREYVLVARMLGSCAFDSDLTSDEGQVFARFFSGPREEDLNGVEADDMAKMGVASLGGGIRDDQHPDAVALRIRLALIGADYRWSPRLAPFRTYLDKLLASEFNGYVSKISHVSQSCRLSFADERRLLVLLNQFDKRGRVTGGGSRRATLVAALQRNPPGPAHDAGRITKVKIHWEEGGNPSTRYAEHIEGCKEIGKFSEDKFWTYVHMDQRQFGDGSGYHVYADKWHKGELCHDGQCTFVSLYAAIRGESNLKVCGVNSSLQVAELLTRYAWFTTSQEDDMPDHTLMALRFLHLLLRARRANPPRHEAWPRIRDLTTGRDFTWIHLTKAHGGQVSVDFCKALWNAAQNELKQDAGHLMRVPLGHWPSGESKSADVTFDPDIHWLPAPPPILVGDDPPILSVTAEGLPDLLSAPTAALGEAYVITLAPEIKDGTLPFGEAQLSSLPGGTREVATSIIKQLLEGSEKYASALSSRCKSGMRCLQDCNLQETVVALRGLLGQLKNDWCADVASLVGERRTLLQEAAVALPRDDRLMSESLDLWVGQRSGDVGPWLEWCIGALMYVSDEGVAAGNLQQLRVTNRLLDERVGETVRQRVLKMLLLTGRVSVLQSAIGIAFGLIAACVKAGVGETLERLAPAERQQILHSAGQLAAVLSVRRDGEGTRTYVDSDGSFDYRFLLFEYVSGFFLRQSQADIVSQLFAANASGEPYIVQMIMGGGKTACVAPLLTLLLAHPQRLVVNVVPDSLVAQTRDIMRGLFGIALSRQVITLAFNREVGRDVRSSMGSTVGSGGDADADGDGSTGPIAGSGLDMIRRLHNKLRNAMEGCAVVITTPVAVKSLMLKYVELELEAQKETKEQSSELARILNMLRKSGVAIIDEVDWVLHPLKSELNFPLGTPVLFDDQAIRVVVAMHIVDAMFLEKHGGFSASAAVTPRFKQVEMSPEVVSIKQKIETAVREGISKKAMQRLPHLLLHSPDFYHAHLRKPLCEWVAAWAEVENPVAADLRKAAGRLQKADLVEYLHMEKVHGTEQCTKVESKTGPKTKRLLSLARTWLHSLLPFLLTKGDRVSYGLLSEQERAAAAKAKSPRSRLLMAVPFVAKDAPSGAAEFAHPDVLIGYTILAYRHEGFRPQDVDELLHNRIRRARLEPGQYAVRQTCREFRLWVEQAQRATEDADLKAMQIPELPVLRFVAGPTLYRQIWQLLQNQGEVIYWYLVNIVFPTVLRKQNRKLSASGQELGSTMVFRNRFGFSGTPSSLLPRELGRCHFDLENIGEIICTLTSPAVVDERVVILEDEWSPKSFLKNLAQATPPFSALIDTGAIVTGMTNERVARTLLAYLPHDFCDGVVFLDPEDRQLIIQRSVADPVPLKESGVSPARRFCFYDQVHTTGIDVKHRQDAKAAITLSASLTYRDYAQGAWRMRGIGLGQTLVNFCTAEVCCRICEVLGQEPDATSPLPFVDALRFLLANAMSSEQKQFNVLQGQNLGTIWRKRALEDLLSRNNVRNALKEFEDTLAFPLPEGAPAPAMLHDGLQETFELHKPYMQACGEGRNMIRDCEELIENVKAAALAASEELGAEVQKEKEQEKEQCVLKETIPMLATESHAEKPWELCKLGDPNMMDGFFPLSEFRMTGISKFACKHDVLVSHNHTRNHMTHDASAESRQLKPVHVLLQWKARSRIFMAAVSLAEAATLRKYLGSRAENPGFELWLRSGTLGDISTSLSRELLPLDDGMRRFGASQQQVLRFFNVDVDFTHEEVKLALESMQATGSTSPEREAIVQILLGARRREAMSWETTMLRKLVYEDKGVLHKGMLLVQELKRQAKSSEVSRLWSYLDLNGDLVLTRDELGDGLGRLGVSFSPDEINTLLRHMDTSNKGTVHLHEFEAAVQVPQHIAGLTDEAKEAAAAEAAAAEAAAAEAAAAEAVAAEAVGVGGSGAVPGVAADADDADDISADAEPGGTAVADVLIRTSSVSVVSGWKIRRHFGEFEAALDSALRASQGCIESRVQALRDGVVDTKSLQNAVVALFYMESRRELEKAWRQNAKRTEAIPVLAECTELKRQKAPAKVLEEAMQLAAQALLAGDVEEDIDAAGFGLHSAVVLRIPQQARKLYQEWQRYQADLAKLFEEPVDPAAAVTEASRVLVNATEGPHMRMGIAAKALFRMEAGIGSVLAIDDGIDWKGVLRALARLLSENEMQPDIQEVGLRVALRVVAMEPRLRRDLKKFLWLRIASTAAAQHAGRSVATVAGWLISVAGDDDPLLAATGSDAWSKVDLVDEEGIYRSAVALPPGSKTKIFAFLCQGFEEWSMKFIDRDGTPVYELFVNYSAAGSVRSGVDLVDAPAASGFFPFGDAQEPFEVVLNFTTTRIEVFVNGQRTVHLDAENPKRTCKTIELAGVLVPHVWAQLHEEGGTTSWQVFSAGGWIDVPEDVDEALKAGKKAGEDRVYYKIGRYQYEADFEKMVQINVKFRTERKLREPIRRALD